MIEIDANGVPRDLRAMTAEALLDHAAHSVTTRRVAERTRLRLAVDWARRHPATAEDKATWAEVDRRLGEFEIGADGCPGIATGAVADLGAAMGLSTRSATILVEDALDLTFRLPKLWARVEAVAVEVSRARPGRPGSPTAWGRRPWAGSMSRSARRWRRSRGRRSRRPWRWPSTSSTPSWPRSWPAAARPAGT